MTDVAGWLVGVVLAGIPLACWIALARARAVGMTVGSVLTVLALAVVAVSAGWLHTVAKLEVLLLFAPASGLVIAVGLRVQRRLVGTEDHTETLPRRAAHVLLTCYLVFLVLLCSPMAVALASEKFTPSDEEVLPLPAGLVVVENNEQGCGSGTCARLIVVGSSDNAPAEAILARLLTHLVAEHGWSTIPGCRRVGFLVDRSELCVSIATERTGIVQVVLEGSRPFSPS